MKARMRELAESHVPRITSHNQESRINGCRFTICELRFTEFPLSPLARHSSPLTVPRLLIPYSLFPIPSSRFPITDSRPFSVHH